MSRFFFYSTLSFVFSIINVFANDVDNLEQQHGRYFFTKRDKNDYDFITIYNPTFSISVDLHEQFIIKASSCVYEFSGFMRFQDGVEIQYFDNQHNILFKIIANKAFYNQKIKTGFLLGNITVQTFDTAKKVVNTNVFYYSQEHKIFFNASFLKILANNLIIEGNNFYAKTDLSYYKIIDPIVFNGVE